MILLLVMKTPLTLLLDLFERRSALEFLLVLVFNVMLLGKDVTDAFVPPGNLSSELSLD